MLTISAQRRHSWWSHHKIPPTLNVVIINQLHLLNSKLTFKSFRSQVGLYWLSSHWAYTDLNDIPKVHIAFWRGKVIAIPSAFKTVQLTFTVACVYRFLYVNLWQLTNEIWEVRRLHAAPSRWEPTRHNMLCRISNRKNIQLNF